MRATDRPNARRRRPGSALAMLAITCLSVVLAVTVSFLFFAGAGLAAAAAYAAWVGVTAGEFLDTIDDTTGPPLGPP